MARGRPSPGRAPSGADTVLKLQNRLITIMRGTETDAYGDETDVGIVHRQHVPAALAEKSSQTSDPAAPVRRTVRMWECILPAWCDVTTDDTLMDETTGFYFMVESIEQQPGPGYYPAPLILTLRMRSGVSVNSDA